MTTALQNHLNYIKNREHTLAERTARYWSNPEFHREARRAERRANPEKFRVRQHEQRAKKPWQHLLSKAKARARLYGYPYSLTKDWAKKTYTGYCAVTRLPFNLDYLQQSGPRPRSPSIDRIDSLEGYTPENCRFVLFAVNSFKGTMSDDEMCTLAKAIIGGGTC